MGETKPRSRPYLKPGYDGPRLHKAPQDLRPFEERRAETVARLHNAMLTLKTLDRDGPSAGGAAWPQYIHDFGDRIGWEVPKTAPKPRFRPSGTMVDDMLPALALLEGLRTEYFHVVYLKAWGDYIFDKISWRQIGDEFSRSESWARDAYDRAILQAMRNAGGLSAAKADEHAVVWFSVLSEHIFLTWIGTASNPRQALASMKANNALPIVDASVLWVAGTPVAKRVVAEARALYGDRRAHGSWFRVNPFDIEDTLLTATERASARWRLETLERIL